MMRSPSSLHRVSGVNISSPMQLQLTSPGVMCRLLQAVNCALHLLLLLVDVRAMHNDAMKASGGGEKV